MEQISSFTSLPFKLLLTGEYLPTYTGTARLTPRNIVFRHSRLGG